MQEEIVIKKEEIEIDDTKIKLELDEDAPQYELPRVGSLMKIIEERPNMITVPVHDYKSEDELKFIESLGMFDQPEKLSVTSFRENEGVDTGLTCEICNFNCENHLALVSHQINHQLNRQFCSHGCGVWCDTLEEILEHEFRQHEAGVNGSICRICHMKCCDFTSLAKHMSSHFFVRRFVCAICRRHFEARQGLQLHWQHSKELCGQIEYADMHANVGQLVAINKLDHKLSSELVGDVKIKTEPVDPMDVQEEQLQSPPNDITIKTEPLTEDDELSTSQDEKLSVSDSLVGKLRGKLRLPSIKKSLKVETSTYITPMPIVSAGNIKSKEIAHPKASSRLPNILKPRKVNEQPKQVPQSNTGNTGNILKMLPSNCMLFKLPPNTKIVKISPSPASVNSNKSTIGSKIITLPSAISIRASSQPLNNQTAGSDPIPAVPTVSAAPNLTTQTDAGLKPNLNRSAFFNALSLFDNLPESRKIIAEFQNKIRSIEQTLPLPGSVLQTPKRNTGKLQSELKIFRVPLTKESHNKVRELRITHSDQRFYWECPNCARCYEQYSAFCNHLTQTHNIAESQFEQTKVKIKTYKKSIDPKTAQASSSPETVSSTAVTQETNVSAVASVATVAAAESAKSSVTAVVPTPDLVPAAANNSACNPVPSTAPKPARSSSTARPAQYKCEDCSKCFTTVGGLRIHKMIHTGELPHKCSYCEKRFRTPGQVRVHQRRHTGEKPFKCKVCSLDFTHRETLISHLSRHIGMKRYKCYGCDKSFVVVSGLRAHRRLRPDTCGKVKFTARAHGPRVRVIKGEVVFESHPEHNGYLRSEDPLNIMSEIQQARSSSESS